MSYIKITNYCNMNCLHCCFSCTNIGENMPLEVFSKAIKINNYITIGGGEPTLHPEIYKIIEMAIDNKNKICIVTNGENKKISLDLLDLSKDPKNNLLAQLSADIYHKEIDGDVLIAYNNDGKIVNYENNIAKAGRAILNIEENKLIDKCICEQTVVEPNGDVKVCGCNDSPIVCNILQKQNYRNYKNRCYKKGIAL